jgi:hypothetical protein
MEVTTDTGVGADNIIVLVKTEDLPKPLKAVIDISIGLFKSDGTRNDPIN